MFSIADSLLRVINELHKLPGIGSKSAQRIAFHILKSTNEDVGNLAKSILDVKEKIMLCSTCNFFCEKDPCEICASGKRDRTTICVVEKSSDVLYLEKSGDYRGVYHVLLGAISPLEGIGPEDLKIKELLNRISGDSVKEIIIATNPDIDGEATAMYIAKLLKPFNVKTSRIAFGIPIGGNIEYADEVTISKAIQGRREI